MLHDNNAVIPLSGHRAQKACSEHTNFTPEKIKELGLVVIKVSDISFDYSNMTCQPRTENINHNTVALYYNQALNGFEGNYGIRTPIKVTKCPLKGSEPYKGLCGHHRYLAAKKAKYTYLVCEVIEDFFDLPEEDQIDIMMDDNAHGNNGMKSDRKSILGNLARTLSSKTYMSKERNQIKELRSYLGSNLTEEQENNVLKRIEPFIDKIKSDLRERVNRWTASSLSSSNVSHTVTTAYNSWNNQENTKIYIHDKKDAETKLIKYMKSQERGKKLLSKRFGQTISNNRVDDRQISGEIAKMIKNHWDDHEQDPDVFFLAVHLSGAPSIRKLLETRKKFAEDIGEYVEFIRPGLKLEVIFYGQIKTTQMYEDHKNFYSLKDITEKLEKLN